MLDQLKGGIYFLIKRSVRFRNFLTLFFPKNSQFRLRILKFNYLKELINSYYTEDSLKEKRFYNIGAGNQRSKYNFWSYIDLESSGYSKSNIDLFYDLESLKPIPLPSNHAEVVFNSFVVEHISIQATKNLCREAFRVLKKGGVFHSKIHCYEYGITLLNKNLISPKIPFECRESIELIEQFITNQKGKIKAFFNDNNEYIIQSLKHPNQRITFNAKTGFIYHNATAAIDNLKEPEKYDSLLGSDKSNFKDFYKNLQKFVDEDKKQPHQHNADYFSKEDLKRFIEDLGFSEVYFTQPYQSVSPTLWEDKLNPIHYGFIFSIEAVK